MTDLAARDGRATPPPLPVVAPPPDVLTALAMSARRAWQSLEGLGLTAPTIAAVLREVVDGALQPE